MEIVNVVDRCDGAASGRKRRRLVALAIPILLVVGMYVALRVYELDRRLASVKAAQAAATSGTNELSTMPPGYDPRTGRPVVFVINRDVSGQESPVDPANVVAYTLPANSRLPIDWLLGQDGGRGSGVVYGDGHGRYLFVTELCQQLRQQQALELPSECGP